MKVYFDGAVLLVGSVGISLRYCTMGTYDDYGECLRYIDSTGWW